MGVDHSPGVGVERLLTGENHFLLLQDIEAEYNGRKDCGFSGGM